MSRLLRTRHHVHVRFAGEPRVLRVPWKVLRSMCRLACLQFDAAFTGITGIAQWDFGSGLFRPGIHQGHIFLLPPSVFRLLPFIITLTVHSSKDISPVGQLSQLAASESHLISLESNRRQAPIFIVPRHTHHPHFLLFPSPIILSNTIRKAARSAY